MGCNANKLLSCFLIILFLFFLHVQVFAEAHIDDDMVSLDGEVEDVAALYKKGHGRPRINCNFACSRRCMRSSRKNVCMRACGTCCFRCRCVPTGTYGNKHMCPCYANLRTHGHRPKCP